MSKAVTIYRSIDIIAATSRFQRYRDTRYFLQLQYWRYLTDAPVTLVEVVFGMFCFSLFVKLLVSCQKNEKLESATAAGI